MKNRKKALKLQAKRKITTHIINNISNMLFYSIKLHYISSTDDYACQLPCPSLTLRGHGLLYSKSSTNVFQLLDSKLYKVCANQLSKQ